MFDKTCYMIDGLLNVYMDCSVKGEISQWTDPIPGIHLGGDPNH